MKKSRNVFADLVALGVAVCAVCAAYAGNTANPDAIELVPLPKPVEFKSNIDSPVPFDETAVVCVDCPDAESVDWVGKHLKEWYGKHSPKVKAAASDATLLAGEEAYAAIVVD